MRTLRTRINAIDERADQAVVEYAFILALMSAVGIAPTSIGQRMHQIFLNVAAGFSP